MATIAVTGAAGHVGANLVRALLRRGHQVRALVHHDRRALQGLDVEVVQADVSDFNSLVRAFTGVSLVYHAAGYISVSTGDWESLKAINILGTRNVIDACLHCGVQRLVYFSTIEALEDSPMDTAVDEARPLARPEKCFPYARSKIAADRLVREASTVRGLDAVILYPTAILGPFDFRLGYPNMGLLTLCNGGLPALIDGGFDWVDVRDVAEGAVSAGEHSPSGEKYILSGHWAAIQDLAKIVEEVCGTRAPRWVLPMWMGRLGAPFLTAFGQLTKRPSLCTSASLKPLRGNRRMSHRFAAKELGYRPRPLKETVIDTLRWFQQTETPVPLLRSPYCDTPDVK